MRRDLVVGGLACAAVGLVVWLWLDAPGARPVTAAARPRSAGPEEEATVGRVLATVPLERSDRADEARAIVAEPDIAALPLAGTASAADPPEGAVPLRVVGPDEEPLEAAQVRVLEGVDPEDDRYEQFRDHARVDALMDAQGRPAVTDATGLVAVGLVEGEYTLVLARRGSLWGARSFAFDPARVEPLELVLAPDATLRARVVSTDGQPVPGVPVQLQHERPWGTWGVQDAVTEGPEAIAVLRHVQTRMRSDMEGRWRLGLDALFDGGPSVALAPADLPEDVVTLEIPPSGALEVLVVDERGTPYPGEAEVTVGIVREGEPAELSPFSRVRRETIERELEGGVARFPHVQPGQQLEVAVERGGSDVATRAYGPGPALPGQTRTFEVRIGADHPVALLHVVDAAGRPVAGTELEVTVFLIRERGSGSDEMRVRSDEQGALRVDLAPGWSASSRRELLVRLEAKDGSEVSARIEASQPLPNGVHDLGAVRLEPSPLLVAGRVVDTAGAPVARAKLRLRYRNGTTYWLREDLDETSDEDGSFAIRGRHMAVDLRLAASVAGASSPSREFVPGTPDLLLEVVQEGALEGRILLDAGFPENILHVSLSGALDPSERSRTASTLEGGAFRFDGLLPGTYDLTLRVSAQRDDVASVAGVTVEGGQITRDPRLDPLDLRGVRSAHHLLLRCPEEEPTFQGTARFGPPGAEQLENRVWFYQPDLWIVSEQAAIDLLVNVAGHLPVHLERVDGEITVALEPTKPVRLVLPSDLPIPEPPLYLKAVLMANDEDHGSVDWGAPAFDERREIEVRVPGTGELKVTWLLERRESGSTSVKTLDVEPPQLVTVDGTNGQRIRLELAPEKLADLLAVE